MSQRHPLIWQVSVNKNYSKADGTELADERSERMFTIVGGQPFYLS